MRRRIAIGAALLAGTALVPAGAPASDPPPSRLLVTAREYSLTLSRLKVAPGQAIVQLYNYGEDPHDLNLRRIGSDRVGEVGEVEPGATGTLQIELRKASRYRLWCSIPTHRGLGMVATLRTRARPPGS
jgi:plastocyanin